MQYSMLFRLNRLKHTARPRLHNSRTAYKVQSFSSSLDANKYGDILCIFHVLLVGPQKTTLPTLLCGTSAFEPAHQKHESLHKNTLSQKEYTP